MSYEHKNRTNIYRDYEDRRRAEDRNRDWDRDRDRDRERGKWGERDRSRDRDYHRDGEQGRGYPAHSAYSFAYYSQQTYQSNPIHSSYTPPAYFGHSSEYSYPLNPPAHQLTYTKPKNSQEEFRPKPSSDLRHKEHYDLREHASTKFSSYPGYQEDLRRATQHTRLDLRGTKPASQQGISSAEKQNPSTLSSTKVVEMMVNLVKNKTNSQSQCQAIKKFADIRDYDEFCDHLTRGSFVSVHELDLEIILKALLRIDWESTAIPLFRVLVQNKLIDSKIITAYIYHLFVSKTFHDKFISEVFQAVKDFNFAENYRYYVTALNCIFRNISKFEYTNPEHKIDILLRVNEELHPDDHADYVHFLDACNEKYKEIKVHNTKKATEIFNCGKQIFKFAFSRSKINPKSLFAYIKILHNSQAFLEIIKTYEEYYRKNLHGYSQKNELLDGYIGQSAIKYFIAQNEVEKSRDFVPDFIFAETIFKHTINLTQLNISVAYKNIIGHHFLTLCKNYNRLDLVASGVQEMINNKCALKQQFIFYVLACYKLNSLILTKKLFQIVSDYGDIDIQVVNGFINKIISCFVSADLIADLLKIWKYVFEHKNKIEVNLWSISKSIMAMQKYRHKNKQDIIDIVQYGLKLYPFDREIQGFAKQYGVNVNLSSVPEPMEVDSTALPMALNKTPETIPQERKIKLKFRKPTLSPKNQSSVSSPTETPTSSTSTAPSVSSLVPMVFGAENFSQEEIPQSIPASPQQPVTERLIEAIRLRQVERLEKLIAEYQEAGLDINAYHLISLPKKSNTKTKQKKTRKKRKNKKSINTTLLMLVAESGSLEALKLFINQGADIAKTGNIKDKTVLYTAVENNFLDIVKYLIQMDTKKSLKNSPAILGRTLMHAAVRTENLELVKCLISYGVEIDTKRNGKKHSAYSYAELLKSKGSPEILEYFNSIKSKKNTLPNFLSSSSEDESNEADSAEHTKYSKEEERAFVMADLSSSEDEESDFDPDRDKGIDDVEDEEITMKKIEDLDGEKKKKYTPSKKNTPKSKPTPTTTTTTTSAVNITDSDSEMISAVQHSLGYLDYESKSNVTQNPFFGSGIGLVSSSSGSALPVQTNSDNQQPDNFDLDDFFDLGDLSFFQ